jgi:hypothetical protein
MKALGSSYRVHVFALLIAALAFAIPGTVLGAGFCHCCGECTFQHPWKGDLEGDCAEQDQEGCGCKWDDWWHLSGDCPNEV